MSLPTDRSRPGTPDFALVRAWNSANSCARLTAMVVPLLGSGGGRLIGRPPGSEVDHVAGEAVERFLECFAEGGVGVDVAGQFGGGQVPLLREGELGKKLRDVRADHVSTEELAARGIGHELYEAARFAEAVGLAVGGEGELGDQYVVAFVAGLLLGEPERSDLRLTEGRTRHHPVVAQRHGLGPGEGLGGDDALCLGDVGELELGGDVADRVQVRR